MITRARTLGVLLSAAFVACALPAHDAQAQAQRTAAPKAPATPRAAAPIDIAGNWVSLITDDWVYRMITPAKGDYSYIPLNAEAKRAADGWDPARDQAAGEECKAYSAPAIMRLPSRVQISWQDDDTLKVDIDTGMQTRLFQFNQRDAQGARSWQGWSNAAWQFSGTTEQFNPRPTSLGQIKRGGVLRVDTNNLRAGYLRKNGVPFSENAFMTEYYNLVVEDDGNQYLVIQLFVADPKYLTGHWVRTVQFKRERDASKRNPTPCSAS
ncbi:MAG: hypothetical protein ABI640_21085 [Gammaproteobacteria bacterium]